MRLVAVDWLGRGGIAECTAAWLVEASGAGRELFVVTRPGRWEPVAGAEAVEASARRMRVAAHLEVVRTATRVIRDLRPDLVLVQNYLLPALEAPVLEAARSVGAHSIWVIHDDRLHSPAAGLSLGIGHLGARASQIIAHSHYVGRRLEARLRRPVRVVPPPQPLRLLASPNAEPPFAVPGEYFLALNFGVLKRAYKGYATYTAIAEHGVAGWTFAALGKGARPHPRVKAVDRFVENAELMAAVRASTAVVLPYRHATQSGAVLLAQGAGAVVVASAVGGIPEQVTDGKTGLLLKSGASPADWCARLEALDPAEADSLRVGARSAALDRHDAFASWVRELTGSRPPPRQ